ncbi:MAG: phosphoglycerate mutase, partial [Candidatus Thermoplasmatota archaeon]
MKEKIFLLVLDGIGDRGNRTSLKIARKKNLDWFAENGICGIMDPIAPGIRPGSDTAHLSILGYNPYEIYTGRGPFEAAGVGMKIDSGDVALRCNFATVASDMTIIDRRAGRINEGTKELAKAIDGMELNGIKIRVKEGTEHRATLVLSGKGLSQKITDIDPHSDGMKVQKAKSLEKNAELTARVLNEFVLRSYRILDQHKINIEREKKGLKKANILLPRGAGIMPKIKNFNEKFNLSSCAIAGVGLIKGICSLLGMKIIEVKGATGGLDTDIDAKIEKGRDALKKYD